MSHISPLPNKLRTTGIQLNSIKVSSVGRRKRERDEGSVFVVSVFQQSTYECRERELLSALFVENYLVIF